MLVLDSGGISRLTERSPQAAAMILELRREGLWPPVVPSLVLVESLTGRSGRDAPLNQFLKTCDLIEQVPVALARRAALLRAQARRGSAVDAIVVACAEPGGKVLTSDPVDLKALAVYAVEVTVERV